MDAGGAAAPVDGDAGGATVRAAVAEHAANPDLLVALRGMEYSDDSVPGFGVPPADFGIPGVRAALARAKVPELVIASWYDAATVFGVLQRYKDVAVPQRVVIVATNHGGGRTADPYGAPAANAAGSLGPQLRLAFAFFQPFLVDATPGIPAPNSITYFTVGENAWKTTAAWPPAGVAAARWYLGAARRLTPAAARGVTESLPLAAVTTGSHSVWLSQLTGEDVVLSEVAQAANAAPAYTTLPLAESIEVTGVAELRLEMSAPIADPSVVAFLLAVAPDGTAYELSQGALRLIHRKLAPSQLTLHTFSRRDALTVVPNAPLDVPIALVPLSATVPKGYRLRIALASGERPVLAATPPYTARVAGTSYLSLPIRPRPDLDTR
jgi:putative CocE/NonD family hydrolase